MDQPPQRNGTRFVFAHPAGTLTVPAFSRTFRVVATAVVGGTAAWMAYLGLLGTLLPEDGAAWRSLALPLVALAMFLYTWWCIQTSRTTLTDAVLHQSWVWDKKMDLHEMGYARLIRVRGLEWLIAPRLYARTVTGRIAVFYAADPDMLARFEQLVAELKAFRAFR